MKPTNPLVAGRPALLCAALACTPLAHAASTWTGAVDSNYNTAGNWNPNGTPAVGTDVEILSGTANVPSGNWDRRGAGYTTIGGTANVTLNSGGQGRFLNTGAFNMNGGTFTHSGEYFIAGAGAVGTINQSGGSISSTLSRGWQLSDNNINQSGSAYYLSGGLLSVTSTATWTDLPLRGVWFGKGGETGGNNSAAIGSATGDLFKVTGGSANFTKTGANTSEVRVSRNSGIEITTGSVSFNNYTEFRVGQGASGGLNSRVILTGGTLDITGGTAFYLGESDNGLLSISGGSMTLDGLLSLGRSTFTGVGTVNLSGGTLSVDSLVNGNGLGVFNFTGGRLYVDGDATALLNESWFNKVQDTTATFDGTRTLIVPEPSFGILLLGTAGILGIRRRR
ncbi:hypothetical protein [Luteolibacter luteus]|uniref:PEP-CTERM sorting domain-containing protein n=1 Tax=Luteolibacter luteus TaxID=2728835 RepID=A0A858RS68_9BACT|nr:hypothetical protein [Luteolibacter luteus]QJE99000.1 hypothetical protein HHL09_25545 [Luteolibacter luteus]